MDNRDYKSELICFDAYVCLRNGSSDALKLLESGMVDEAREKLSAALSLSRLIYQESADLYLFSLP